MASRDRRRDERLTGKGQVAVNTWQEELRGGGDVGRQLQRLLVCCDAMEQLSVVMGLCGGELAPEAESTGRDRGG